MDKQTKIDYWLELSHYDFETARAMLKTKRFLYVGFMCHQVIEKALKAYYLKELDETPPFTHDLAKLATLSKFIEKMSDDQIDLLYTLNPLNIESRYPSYKEKISKTLTSDFCNNVLDRTEELLKWIEQQLLI